METGECHLAFDGSLTHRDGGAGVVLYNPDETNISLSFKLEIPCSNNEADMRL